MLGKPKIDVNYTSNLLNFVKVRKTFQFGSKAETLARLDGELKRWSIPQFRHFDLARWQMSHDAVLADIADLADGKGTVIVRSSARNEDGELYAQAGAFLSVPHIPPADRAALISAIEEVFASYRGAAAESNSEDQVLVQKMVDRVSMSGVIFTQVLSSGAPYYVVNYDDETGLTDSVTSGTGYVNRTIYIHRDHVDTVRSERFLQLLSAVREIEQITGESSLDIEFAIDMDHHIHLFQARRITAQPNWSRGLSQRIDDALVRLEKSVAPRLLLEGGDSKTATILGKMPDWNPAEIIGNAPRRLAFSLYRYVITDSVWRVARERMGYFHPRGKPLMVSCAGQPYIDVRQSLRSFIPATIPDDLANRMVLYWLHKLADNPLLHDKVEFGIALTAWTFDFDTRARQMLPEDVTQDEMVLIHEAYREMTVDLVDGRRASVAQQVIAVNELQARYEVLAGEQEHPPTIDLARELLENCIELGTIPFSILARHGFIAKALLQSLREEGLLSGDDINAFNQSITSVVTEFIVNIHRFREGEIKLEDLLRDYGHLRPGTYDIMSLRYDQRGEEVFSISGDSPPATEPFVLSPAKSAEIEKRLSAAGFSLSCNDFLQYCREAIRGREWAKLVFTRSISACLEVLAAWGEDQRLSRDELSHLDIRELMDCTVVQHGRSFEEHLRVRAESGRREHEVTTGVRLPFLLTRHSDLFVVPMLLEQPNFVTLKQVTGVCLHVSSTNIAPGLLDGKIVAIESADPGFDWIFTRNILGLVTQFGGANSHMAIRCAELNIPAAIGCGEQIFERVTRSNQIELDCAAGTIKLVEH
ncbi:Pyruvate phosphate dikinase, PEP/pyruvate binding domain [Ectothiorhodosinus mongolicus]|uniref:Pyruvate phosphate dikinase, PEP/pyruvate binding domain n=1 Tax=Ectothiorhodosinus mongolicus TaxID=233100 RepID=A0A1R3VVJ2_9GAMM|nr:PEP-utilizing enzyme [Ectothiorhodosinus mongolicus]SIT68359.1 Pyruvate phosphate dikinase, PEP/pyruvate binding domain [Ectothiorhodosinus mongolicus]